MRVRTIAILAAVVSMAAFVAGVGLGERRVRDATPAEVARTGEQAPTQALSEAGPMAKEAAPETASAATTFAWPPLPAMNLPAAQVFDELAERARRGDAAAACRLASDLQRCGKILGQRELAADLQDQAARYEQAPTTMIDAIGTIERQQEGVGDRCDGLQPAQLAQAFDFQRQAALARPELRVWFALNPALERRDFVNELERWAEYRRLAMPWLEAAARRGDAAALFALARVHGDLRRNSPPYPPFRLDDPVRALAYNELLLRLGVDLRGIHIGADTARARLDADGRVRAADLVDELSLHAGPALDKQAIQAAMSRSFEPVVLATECELR
jgi:hypothetical protein